MKIRTALLLILLLSAAACTHVPARQATGTGWVQTGQASWYGRDFHGKPTASGEKYNMYGLSAAHKTLPLGTTVRVTNLDNKRHVTVKVNDRGPFVGKRIIDMSYGAARKLDMVESGLANVRIEVINTPDKIGQTYYVLQFGAYSRIENAEVVQKKLLSRGYNPSIEKTVAQGQALYRVRVGHYTTVSRAQKAAEPFSAQGIPCIVVALQ